ncbi:MAG: restriction endonuclease [Candidatus Obscuribacterales bacterium]|nr:restriction endonuclease [Candidatus Obscuribacterales bacterium]
MPIPTYQELYKDILSVTSVGEPKSMRQLRDALAQRLKISEEEQALFLPSGKQKVWDSRVGWAKTYLVKAGLLSQPKRGFIQLEARGTQVLVENPAVIDDAFLMRFPGFKEFKNPGESNGDELKVAVDVAVARQTPEEMMESAYQQLRQQVESEILARIMSCTPAFFEQLVVDLLLRMGYGGSRIDAGKAIGQSGDGGIDGIIKEDKLGLDTLYIQAKRWINSVGRPEVQQFAGALHGQRARKGVMITTSTFTKDARNYANSVDTKIVLIDGKSLTQLMFDHGLGCASQSSYELKKVDSDYFEPDSSAD